MGTAFLTGQTGSKSVDNAIGNATISDVLSGKTFSSSNGVNLTGNIPIASTYPTEGSGLDLHLYTTSPNPTQGNHNVFMSVPAGYYSNGTWLGYLEPNLKASNIKSGVTVGNGVKITGTFTGVGTAAAAQVLTGYTFSNGSLMGTGGSMPNNGAQSATITTQGGTKTIPAGYTTGGTVTASFTNLTAGNVKSGVNIGGVVGTFSGLTGAIIKPFTIQAGQTITIGDFVSFASNTGISVPTSTAYGTRVTAVSKVVTLSSTKFLIFFEDYLVNDCGDDYDHRVKCIIGTVSGNTVTFGSELQLGIITAPGYAGDTYDVAAISANRAIAYFNTNGTTYVMCLINTSGTTPTLVTSATNAIIADRASIVGLSSTLAVIAFTDSTSTSWVRAINIASDTLSMGTQVAFYGSSQGVLERLCINVSATSFVILFRRTGPTVAAIAGTVSGTTITMGTSIAIEGATDVWRLSGYRLSDSKIAICYNITSSTVDYTKFCTVSISGNTLTQNVKYSLDGDSEFFLKNSASSFFLIRLVGSEYYGRIVNLSIDAFDIPTTESFMISDISSYLKSGATLEDFKFIAVSSGPTTYRKAKIIITKPEIVKSTVAPFYGIAKTAGSGGATIDIYTL